MKKLVTILLLLPFVTPIYKIGMCEFIPLVFCPLHYVGNDPDEFDGVSYLLLM